MARLKQESAPERPEKAGATRSAFLESLPAQAPLAMPTQDLQTHAGPASPLPRAGRRAVLMLAATGLLTVGAAAVMGDLLLIGGVSALDVATFVLFLLLFSWTAFGFVSAVAGFLVTWGTPSASRAPQPIIFTRTALLLPTYNEDAGRILAAIQAIHEDLARMGVSELYDLYVLSDTRDEAVARAEAVGVLRLRMRIGGQPRIFYRRRRLNTDRKAGNIAEWVRRFGAAYESMIILDADSLMSADTIVRLTAQMEADPKLGLLQTVPTIINGETLFARLQQFAARTYGFMLAAGQDWWSGNEGNYWGHNAIVRVRAFAAHAGLPHLPGRRPFGGHIMSHDFVEAALLRRAGWSVRLTTRLTGSYEETPPTILDMARRDRRWCQGNLQHVGVVGAAGFHWVSRLHLVRGVLAYLTSPLWLLLLCTGAASWVGQGAALGPALAQPAAWLFALTMALLIAPKLMAGALSMREARLGLLRSLGMSVGIAWEIVLSALVAPVLMLMQSASVLDVLIGRDAGWGTQQRDPGRMSRREAWRTHRGHMAIGVVGAAFACFLDPVMFWWTSPVSLGLVLSAPLSALLSRADIGRALGLFATPEERSPPTVVARATELRAAYDREEASRREIERLFRAPVPAHHPAPMPNQTRPAYLPLAS